MCDHYRVEGHGDMHMCVCVVRVLATVLLPACAWSVIRVSMCPGRFDPLAFAWAGVTS